MEEEGTGEQNDETAVVSVPENSMIERVRPEQSGSKVEQKVELGKEEATRAKNSKTTPSIDNHATTQDGTEPSKPSGIPPNIEEKESKEEKTDDASLDTSAMTPRTLKRHQRKEARKKAKADREAARKKATEERKRKQEEFKKLSGKERDAARKQINIK